MTISNLISSPTNQANETWQLALKLVFSSGLSRQIFKGWHVWSDYTLIHMGIDPQAIKKVFLHMPSMNAVPWS
jgi:hypothetical protein